MAENIVTQLQQLSASLGRGEGRSTVLGAAAEIERLRDELAAWQATVRAHDALAAERADEVERLRRWQSQATTVIENWDAVFDALIDAKPTDLGVSKSVLVAKEIIWLRAEAARLGAFLHPIGEQARRW